MKSGRIVPANEIQLPADQLERLQFQLGTITAALGAIREEGVSAEQKLRSLDELKRCGNKTAAIIQNLVSDAEKQARSNVGIKGASARLAKDNKQAEKPKVRKLWEDWQSRKTIHKNQAAFARFAIRNCSELESEETIKRWDREWRKEAKQR